MGLTGKQIHDVIAQRKEREKQARQELETGGYRYSQKDAPPLLAGLTPVSEIAPRVKSAIQRRRDVQEKIHACERALKNKNLVAAERKRIEAALAELQKQSGPEIMARIGRYERKVGLNKAITPEQVK